MTIRLGDLLKVPGAIIQRLEDESDHKADRIAENILFKITGRKIGNSSLLGGYDDLLGGYDDLLKPSHRRFTQHFDEI